MKQRKKLSLVSNNKCKKCENYSCNVIYFQQDFKSWTSGNIYIDEFIKDTQLSAHHNIRNAIEWIPYKRIYDTKYIEKIGVFKANWIDGYIEYWDDINQKWEKAGKNMIITLKSLSNPKEITLDLMNKIKTVYEFYGITQDPQTKNYMMVLNEKCKKCNFVCNAIHFQQYFESWTSGNDDIDKFIQGIQLLAHENHNILNHKVFDVTLEWIPYNKLYNIKYIKKIGVYKANWIDGYINYWDNKYQNWRRYDQYMIITLKSLSNPKEITLDFMNEIKTDYEFYGLTQDPQTKNYMMVLNDKCKKCNYVCYAIYFQRNFESWTSGNSDINKFIQDAQLSAHNDLKEALEWIPYDRIYNIKYVEEICAFKANWIDGYITYWNHTIQSWRRNYKNMIITLKSLSYPKEITLDLMNEIKTDYLYYGITQDPQTKNYMMVLNEKCKKCNNVCYAIYFQRNFESWTSGNDDINKFIQDTQLSAHFDVKKALEWIPYDRFYDIEYIEKIGIFKANWIDGYINYWDNENHNWERYCEDMIITLKSLSNPKEITLDLMNEIKTDYEFYGITQDPITKNYMMVLSYFCNKCNFVCNAIHFQRNFKNWTSGNDDIDKFIQSAQLSAHGNYEVFKSALEWIPYKSFTNIEYIAKGGFGKVYRANWAYGYISRWNYENCDWVREGRNMLVALKSINSSKYVTLKFMNEITLHYRERINNNIIIGFYGITQDPKTNNYMMILHYAKNGSLRNYLDINYNELNWMGKIGHLHDIAKGLESIHNNNLIHRDLHIGNILHSGCLYITDMGLCKPADYNPLESANNNIYGVLPYVAPEILRKQNDYTKASDIYSFGIIMYELISGLPPYYDISHNEYLAIKICNGIRPRFNFKVPQLIVHLIKRCLDANPLNRPTTKEIAGILGKWKDEMFLSEVEIKKQIEEANRINNDLSTNSVPTTNLSYNTHSEAIYTSRLLNFSNLSEPKNSYDYYEQNDDIISMEFAVSLSQQIDISQLNINDDDFPELKNPDDNYEQIDNIIGVEFSASTSQQTDVTHNYKPKNSDYEQNNEEYLDSLQIDVSQLNINEDDKL
ncbi:hypothetical protein C1646_810080 [Rhizophagus diaphanus]|nr:hypothetical protein C1646_810080 [Rhizophagus diaphanus] [Rhizophagus sp. MUCL 43196]